ncbi:hypothetical protein J3E68DRAFT_390528 [Trichoderma sp. SZMC 28012]
MPAHDNPGGHLLYCRWLEASQQARRADTTSTSNLLLDAPLAQRSNTGMREGLTERIGAGAGFTHRRLDYGLAAAKSPVASSIHLCLSSLSLYLTATTNISSTEYRQQISCCQKQNHSLNKPCLRKKRKETKRKRRIISLISHITSANPSPVILHCICTLVPQPRFSTSTHRDAVSPGHACETPRFVFSFMCLRAASRARFALTMRAASSV